MKRLPYILAVILFSLFFSSCKNINTEQSNLDAYVASELSKIESINELNDETIKTLSVIYRTSVQKNDDLTIADIDKEVEHLTRQTSSITLSKPIKVSISNKPWLKTINKSELLDFFKLKNISLASFNIIKIKNDNFNNATHLIIGSNEISFLDFLNYFNLPSNKNITLYDEGNIFKIEGFGEGINFDCTIEDINNLADNNMNYYQILEKINQNTLY